MQTLSRSSTNQDINTCSRLSPDAGVFLGVGSASALELGNAALVITQSGKPWLQIDCGFDTPSRFEARFQQPIPAAVFITHLHYDHVGGLEQLYFRAALLAKQIKLYVPAALVTSLAHRLNQTSLAEGMASVWDTFQLVPVIEKFWHQQVCLYVYPARHHAPDFSFSLHLPGHFYYSGDTRPIPEHLCHYAVHGETVFHDCGVVANPSHTGLDELLSQYPVSVLNRTYVYHYSSAEDVVRFEKAGLKVAKAGETISF